jgi:hypothetical protein
MTVMLACTLATVSAAHETMSQAASYPVADYGPAMKGLVIGGIGILHVFLAQLAIGGGMVMLYAERLQRAPGPLATSARQLQTSLFRTLVILSFVLGAVTGVGMWLTTIQVGARTIGLMWACPGLVDSLFRRPAAPRGFVRSPPG